MTLATWLSLVAICCIGAMSPGPSLAVVLRHTLINGRRHGMVTGVSHAMGVALWAMLSIFGLALLVVEQPLMYRLITYSGAAYLAWMGVKAMRSKGSNRLSVDGAKAPLLEAARDGLMISLLNPKLAIFFVALFSQFVSADLTRTDHLIMVATATLIDASWYLLVALALSHSRVIERLQNNAVLIDRVSGGILVALALRVVTL